MVDDGRSDWWLVRTLPTANVASTEGWVPSAALTLLMQEEPEPPKEPPKEVSSHGQISAVADTGIVKYNRTSL